MLLHGRLRCRVFESQDSAMYHTLSSTTTLFFDEFFYEL